MTHSVTNVANNPDVKAASTTSGTHNTEATNPTSHTPPANAHPRVARRTGLTGKSTTSNKAHALSIQLSSKGTTPVDGLLVKGLSHGKTKHSTSKTLRAVARCFSKEGMGGFSSTQTRDDALAVHARDARASITCSRWART
jgi:hypothetical protein